MSHLTDYEVDELQRELAKVLAKHREADRLTEQLARLFREMREIREQEGAREFFESQEQVG